MPYALVIVPASILRLLRVLSKNRSFLWPPMLSQIHFSASSAWKRAANLALRPIGSSSLTRHGWLCLLAIQGAELLHSHPRCKAIRRPRAVLLISDLVRGRWGSKLSGVWPRWEGSVLHRPVCDSATASIEIKVRAIWGAARRGFDSHNASCSSIWSVQSLGMHIRRLPLSRQLRVDIGALPWRRLLLASS